MTDFEHGAIPEPDDLQTLLDSESRILTFSGIDAEAEIRYKLDMEWEQVPLVNHRLIEDVEGQEDKTHRLLLVHIQGFFTDGTDFVYFIKGGSNMSKFLAGTFSGKPYDRPCFATPNIIFPAEEIFGSAGLDTFSLEKVSKTESKGIRWRYLYESAVKAWEKLSWSVPKYERIRRRNDEIDEQMMIETSSAEPEVEVQDSKAGNTPETAGTTPGPKEDDADVDAKGVTDSDVELPDRDDVEESDEDEEMIG